jgi:hypothetical protein
MASYFNQFFAEKSIPYAQWEIPTPDGFSHLIDSDFVITLIKQTTGTEAAKLRTVLRRLDLANAPILPFLQHLATGYVTSGAGAR